MIQVIPVISSGIVDVSGLTTGTGVSIVCDIIASVIASAGRKSVYKLLHDVHEFIERISNTAFN